MLLLLTGGARSGKSRLAVAAAVAAARPVHVVATAVAGDDEMRRRIAAHRRERPGHWRTVEAPTQLAAALSAAPGADCVVVDCLSLWVSNLMAADTDGHEIERLAAGAASVAAGRSGPTIVVTNEVGQGVVPMHPVGRAYRDLLGRTNAVFAARADRALLVVAGRVVTLETVTDAGALLRPVTPPG